MIFTALQFDVTHIFALSLEKASHFAWIKVESPSSSFLPFSQSWTTPTTLSKLELRLSSSSSSKRKGWQGSICGNNFLLFIFLSTRVVASHGRDLLLETSFAPEVVHRLHWLRRRRSCRQVQVCLHLAWCCKRFWVVEREMESIAVWLWSCTMGEQRIQVCLTVGGMVPNSESFNLFQS